MQYVGSGRARKGHIMELGGVGEGGGVRHNSTSPPPGSAAAIDTAAALDPNGTFAAPDPNDTSTSAGIGTSATPGGDATPVQPLATAAQDQLNLMAAPFCPRPRPAPLLLPNEMPPPRLELVEQDESHDLKWSVLLWLQQGGPACANHKGMWVCPFCHRGHMQWTIRDLRLHVNNITVLPTWSWDTRVRHLALEEYMIQEKCFAALRAAARFS
jgi:hypothetical protein